MTINLPNGGITLSETTPVRFTFLTLPVEQTELTLVLSFGSSYSLKRSLALKDAALVTTENPDGWITADARKKVYISNISAPNDLWVYTLDVEGNYTTSVAMAGGTVNYTVKSYRTSTTNSSNKEPVTWTTQYSVDGGAWTTTCPDWLQSFNTTGPGSIASPWEPDAATLPANDTPMVWEGSTTPVATTQATARDLSCYDIYGNFTGGVEGTTPNNTANCYVVGAPGWYRIPCVYGNAIKNGADNPASYTGPASGANLMTGGFLNHADAHITSPWIKDNKSGTASDSPSIVIDGATLVWQDHQGLITEVAYDSDYLYFKVSEANIWQGNALLAVKSGDTIVWSWHIWVVDNPEIRLAIKNVFSHPTNHHSVVDPVPFLGEPLGFCDTEAGAIRSRYVRVRFIQDLTGNERVIAINQLGQVSFNSTYYQFGRKDPMAPGIINYQTTHGGGSTDKPLFDISNNSVTMSVASGRVSLSSAIQNPFRFYSNQSATRNWTFRYDNLWNTNVTTAIAYTGGGGGVYSSEDILVCKTIYDPCPPGFKIPNTNVFTGFTYSGEKIGTSEAGTSPLIQGTVPIEDVTAFNSILGYHFYVDQLDPSRGTIFFPRTGARWYGGIEGVGQWADYTTAGPVLGLYWISSSVEAVSYLTIARNYVSPFSANPRAFAFAARPIAE
ncbi:MAG: hypothetical protein IKH49_07160 [Bacteroidales bacterium]|nr:hypothetical protein [Bacteroidales bacterium]